ncbi:MAG TPA: Hsp20/alpha crystallin family protein [Usitatibacter sp.]|nr:Hsp20/alpha crystallin family protein [Usitatibacter sp.]
MTPELTKWNPFKFMRKSDEPRAPSRSQAETAPDPLRVMGELFRDPLGGLATVERWFGDFSPGTFQPRIDVVDDGQALRITAELPGLERKDVEILVEDEFLVLRGEKKLETKKEEKGCYHVERSFGTFQRVVPLPRGVDTDRAEAKFENGTLTIRLPKAASEPSGTRKLEIH